MIDFSKILDARVFLIGVLLAFAALSVAGWLATDKNMFLDFKRIHRDISIETQFYPTARELAALTRDKLSSDKISVIIAGSSVMRGTGQSLDDLWSSSLENELGDKYQVLNLAVNGGGPGGQGLYMAELMLKEGRKIIFVSDVAYSDFKILPDNGPLYRGFFFDAESRGYLDNFPERTARVFESLSSADYALLTEQRINAYLNSYLNFNDLWTTIGYRYFFTMWTSLTINAPWTPRGILPDAETNCDPDIQYKNSFRKKMNLMQSLVDAKPLGEEVVHAVATTISGNIRPRTIFVITRYSPYYADKLNSLEKEKYILRFENAVSKYQSLGITSVAMGQNYLAEDYCDHLHFSYSGGQKLATGLAPHIKQKAKELGYE